MGDPEILRGHPALIRKNPMRWFTCTPVAFGGGSDFFARDSGLLSRGFRMISVESMAVMPGERKQEDEADLIRTDYANLESAEWWRAQNLDGVVLYAWGAPRYRRVAKAIRDSGARLVLNQDSSGMVSPLCGLRPWLREQAALNGGMASMRTAAAIAKGITLGLLRTDPLRAFHLKQGDLIAALHPEAADNFRRLCRIYGGRSLAERVTVIPHAISPSLAYEQGSPPKQNRIIAIGRWDDVIQKRPALLTEVIGRLLSRDEHVAVDLVGNLTERIQAWHHGLPPEAARRVHLHGKLPHEEIRCLLLAARILYCPSAYESFHIASAEALCCGCSVVAADKPALASLRWFVSRDSGTLAATDDAHGHLDALRVETALWETGGRDPLAISRTWCETLHADKVAERIIKVIAENQNPR